MLTGSSTSALLPTNSDAVKTLFSAAVLMIFLSSAMIVSLTKVGWWPGMVPSNPGLRSSFCAGCRISGFGAADWKTTLSMRDANGLFTGSLWTYLDAKDLSSESIQKRKVSLVLQRPFLLGWQRIVLIYMNTQLLHPDDTVVSWRRRLGRPYTQWFLPVDDLFSGYIRVSKASSKLTGNIQVALRLGRFYLCKSSKPLYHLLLKSTLMGCSLAAP